MESTHLIIRFLIAFILLLLILRLYWASSSRLYSHINRHFKIALSPIIAPGVMIHEISHAILCLVLFRRIKSMSLYSFNHSTGELGYVEYCHSSRGPFTYLADSLIAFAPLAGAILSILILGKVLLPEAVTHYMATELSIILETVHPLNLDFWLNTSTLYQYILSNMEFGPKEVLWLFLVVSISHGAAPSSTDLRLATPGIAMITASLVILAALFPSSALEVELSAFEYFSFLLTVITTLAIPTMLLLITVWIASRVIDLFSFLKAKNLAIK